jgi:hypothetical protein
MIDSAEARHRQGSVGCKPPNEAQPGHSQVISKFGGFRRQRRETLR